MTNAENQKGSLSRGQSPSNKYITINQLFEKLPESELKAIQVYFDIYVNDKLNRSRYNCKILKIALVFKDGTQKFMEFKEINDLFPFCHYLTVPRRAFCNITTLTKRLRKLYIKAERTEYKKSFYHDCKAVDVDNQFKLHEFQKQRTQVYLNLMAECCAIKDEEIDEDDF